jgi:hypothetical protein
MLRFYEKEKDVECDLSLLQMRQFYNALQLLKSLLLSHCYDPGEKFSLELV